MTTPGELPRLHGRPDRIFVSVDESSGRSTISFMPPDVGAVIQHEGDKTGELAMRDAQVLASRYPGSTVHGPHFHAARPPGKKIRPRKPA